MHGGAATTGTARTIERLVAEGAHVPFEAFVALALQLVPTRSAALAAAEAIEQRSTRPHDDEGLTARRLRLSLLTGLFSD